MPFKKVSAKEWKAMGLPSSITTISLSPYFKWDHKKKEFKKPILVLNLNDSKKKK